MQSIKAQQCGWKIITLIIEVNVCRNEAAYAVLGSYILSGQLLNMPLHLYSGQLLYMPLHQHSGQLLYMTLHLQSATVHASAPAPNETFQSNLAHKKMKVIDMQGTQLKLGLTQFFASVSAFKNHLHKS